MAEKSKAHAVLDEWDKLYTRQRLWHTLWQDVADLIHPRQSNIQQNQIPAVSQTERLFDSTAVHANALLAASMQGSLTSSSTSWFGLRIRGLQLDEAHTITQFLERCSTIMHDEIRQSNFSSQAHELYADLGAFGIGAVFLGERDKMANQQYSGLRFEALAPGQYAVDEDGEGRINRLFYLKRLSPTAAIDLFGMMNVSEKVRKAAERHEQEVVEFVHGVYPRKEYNSKAYEQTRRANKMPFASCWVEVAAKMLVKEGGFDEFPFMVPRWSVASGEVYGRGPGFIALPDVKTLNKATELNLKALSKAIDPPMKVRDDGVIGSVRLIPGSLTYVRDMDAVQVLDLGGRFDVTAMELDKLKHAIRQIFFTDQLQLQEGPQMTAYEVQVRYELMQRILGPTLGRLETEFLDPMLNRIFWVLSRAKRLPPMPEELSRWLDAGNVLDIAYEGPLARAARMSDVVALQRFMQLVVPIAEAQPDVMDNVDLDALVRDAATGAGVKAKIMRDPKDVARLRQAKAELDRQQQEQAAIESQAKSAGSLAPAVKALVDAQGAGILPQTGIQGVA